jgi:hypothetical protein
MKGLMVTLLMFLTTGIVVGQQTDTQFQTGNRSTSSRNGNNFSPNQTDPSLIKPFELWVDDDGFKGFVNGTPLWSQIKAKDDKTKRELPVDVVNAITLVHDDYRFKPTETKAIYGKAAGKELHFLLYDYDLKSLDEGKKLVYNLDESERGKYEAVRFFFKGNETQNSQPQSRPSTAFDTRQPSGPAPDNNPLAPIRRQPTSFGQSRQTVFLPPPGPGPEPGEVEFEGPVQPTRNRQDSNQQVTWNANTRPQTNPAFENRNNQETSFPTKQTNPNANPIDWDAIERLEAAKRLAEKREADRLARIQTNNSPWRTPRTEYNQPTQQEIADLLRLKEEIENGQAQQNARARYLADREAEVKKAEAEIAYQKHIAALKTSGPSAITPTNYENAYQPTGRTPGYDVPAHQPIVEKIPQERWASNVSDQFNSDRDIKRLRNSGPGIRSLQTKDFTASIPADLGPQDTSTINPNENGTNKNEKDGRAWGFIYFMLLCSLGLNIYLMLLSRGFYVRYYELADELKDTFAATM